MHERFLVHFADLESLSYESMTATEKLKIFQAQCKNVQELEKAWKQVNRTINKALLSNDQPSLQIHTKIQSLVFSAWAEALFSKLIHTPYGFSTSEIIQIKSVSDRDISNGWIKAIDLGLRRVTAGPKSNFKPNVKQKLDSFVQRYVVSPQRVRNKIAHGQWAVALNNKNTQVNPETTTDLANVTIISNQVLKTAFTSLAGIIESLIESPNRAFHRNYWVEINKMESALAEMSAYTVEAKKTSLLQNKPSRSRRTTQL
jgi:hypothetical protein